MRLQISSKNLSKAVALVARSVAVKTPNPILSSVLFQASSSALTLTGTDSDLAVIASVPAQVIQEGECLIALKTLSDLIRTYPECDVEISTDENSVVLISAPSSEVKLLGRSSQDYPKTQPVNMQGFITLDAAAFQSMIRESAFAAARLEGSQQNPSVMTGVLIELSSGKARLVALNGFVMAIRDEPCDTDQQLKCVVPARAMAELLRIMQMGESAEVLISISRNRFIACSGPAQLQTSLLNGEFINYVSIVPKDVTTVVKAPVQELLESLDRASLMGDSKSVSIVSIAIEDSIMTLRSENDEGRVTEEVGAQKSGEDLMISFNTRYLIEVLKAIPDERVILEFAGPQSPGLVKPVGSEKFLYLIMPVRS